MPGVLHRFCAGLLYQTVELHDELGALLRSSQTQSSRYSMAIIQHYAIGSMRWLLEKSVGSCITQINTRMESGDDRTMDRKYVKGKLAYELHLIDVPLERRPVSKYAQFLPWMMHKLRFVK